MKRAKTRSPQLPALPKGLKPLLSALGALVLFIVLLGSTRYPMARQLALWTGRNIDFIRYPTSLKVDGFKMVWAYSGWRGPSHYLTPNRSDLPVQNLSDFESPMVIAGLPFQKGFGVHAPSEMAFDLQGGASHFSCQVGLDRNTTEAQTFGVQCSLVGDGKVLAQSPKLTLLSSPCFLEADLKGVRQLVLRADTFCLEDVGSDVDWVDPKFEH
jgi:hypothetical protein